ncbi:hypothetical protein N7509_012223 [Penicillium cosmopolitanum]|uniref:Uncharacterized protein n=1 Tax=Penicillium cosmopolitanum TaxID=1131564 RepID=A0A9W9VFP5_9EURO|nr:uncharacterized protein N7509_012223 [Penicillium cosmopolitanum]KAJ5379104.1 hypothetical protein N7509_012223 [Penicillium cosmopolitanum]
MAIDGPHNGWRYLFLPVAHQDQLVMNAVLTVSAFHMSFCNSKMRSLDNEPFTQPGHNSPDNLYKRTIEGLKQRDLAKCNYEEMQPIIATILVLLTAVMVNGRNDFPILFSLLVSATNVIGGEDQLAGNELGDFMLRQVRK